MKEYEVVAKLYNACAGAGRPQTFFEEAALEDPGDYVRAKHSGDFPKFTREVLPDGQICYYFGNGAITYRYEFTEV